jgi:predicted nucleic acid-binding protein
VILVDTSVWIDHFRADNPQLAALLDRGQVLCHPLVIGELATVHFSQRAVILAALHGLPRAEMALDKKVLRFIERERLFGIGLGYIDIHLMAAIRLTRARCSGQKTAGCTMRRSGNQSPPTSAG